MEQLNRLSKKLYSPNLKLPYHQLGFIFLATHGPMALEGLDSSSAVKL
jgi:hypothetical protein